MRVKCLAQEHNTMTWPGLEPGPLYPESSALTTRHRVAHASNDVLMFSSCSQDLLEAIKPVLEEEQLQDAADSLFMESDSYDAKILYHAMKV